MKDKNETVTKVRHNLTMALDLANIPYYIFNTEILNQLNGLESVTLTTLGYISEVLHLPLFVLGSKELYDNAPINDDGDKYFTSNYLKAFIVTNEADFSEKHFGKYTEEYNERLSHHVILNGGCNNG